MFYIELLFMVGNPSRCREKVKKGVAQTGLVGSGWKSDVPDHVALPKRGNREDSRLNLDEIHMLRLLSKPLSRCGLARSLPGRQHKGHISTRQLSSSSSSSRVQAPASRSPTSASPATGVCQVSSSILATCPRHALRCLQLLRAAPFYIALPNPIIIDSTRTHPNISYFLRRHLGIYTLNPSSSSSRQPCRSHPKSSSRILPQRVLLTASSRRPAPSTLCSLPWSPWTRKSA